MTFCCLQMWLTLALTSCCPNINTITQFYPSRGLWRGSQIEAPVRSQQTEIVFVLGGSRGTPQTDHCAVALFQKRPSVGLYRASVHQLCSLGEAERSVQGWCDAAGLQQETSTSTQAPSLPIVSQPLAGSPSSFLINDSSRERRFFFFSPKR